MSIWDKYVLHWQNVYYTELIWLCFSLINLIILIKKKRFESIDTYFSIYISIGVIFIIIGPILFVEIFNLTKLERKVYLEVSNIIFSLSELICFLIFYKSYFKENRSRINIGILAILLFGLFAFFEFQYFSKDNSNIILLEHTSYLIGSLSLLGLFMACLCFYLTLLTKISHNETPYIKRPSIWITNGLFIYCSISLPFLLAGGILRENYKEIYLLAGSLHYLSICILHFCLFNAFLCKSSLMK
jgi:ABC-type multidrug transport system fused ATPase/permease subunit